MKIIRKIFGRMEVDFGFFFLNFLFCLIDMNLNSVISIYGIEIHRNIYFFRIWNLIMGFPDKCRR